MPKLHLEKKPQILHMAQKTKSARNVMKYLYIISILVQICNSSEIDNSCIETTINVFFFYYQLVPIILYLCLYRTFYSKIVQNKNTICTQNLNFLTAISDPSTITNLNVASPSQKYKHWWKSKTNFISTVQFPFKHIFR